MIAVLALAAPAAAATPEFNAGAELLRVMLSLVGIIALIVAAGWLSRRLQARAVPGGRRIRCVETLAVGARDRVLLLEAQGKRLLVGAGPGGLRTLHVFDGELPAEETAPPAAPAPGFAELLNRWKRTP